MPSEIKSFSSSEELYVSAADFVSSMADVCIKLRGRFTLAISGGRTPKGLFDELCQGDYAIDPVWQKTYLFWADERARPPDHADSNYALASRLISRTRIPHQQVFRMPADLPDLARAADEYEQLVRHHVSPSDDSKGVPSFDLILLGMGDDGHTASLFPGDALVDETQRLIAPTEPRGKPRTARLTMTLPLINAARHVAFLVAGSEKKEVLNKIFKRPEGAVSEYPAARVHPLGQLSWFVCD